MVRVWYIENNCEKMNGELHLSGGLEDITSQSQLQFLSLEELYKKTGIEYYKLETDTLLQEIRQIRGYIYEDEVEICQETLHKYADEHMHSDDESRLVLEGSGYFDARDATDRWLRIEIGAGDMLILPAGIYHRFTLNTENPIRLRRFFTQEPMWTAFNRPEADLLPARKTYLKRAQTGFNIEAVAS